MFYLPNMHSKNLKKNVVSVDVNVNPRYSKPPMHDHKVQITNFDDSHLRKKHWKIKTGHSDFRFLGSVITPSVVGAILL